METDSALPQLPRLLRVPFNIVGGGAAERVKASSEKHSFSANRAAKPQNHPWAEDQPRLRPGFAFSAHSLPPKCNAA
jgi:hypothetical protein